MPITLGVEGVGDLVILEKHFRCYKNEYEIKQNDNLAFHFIVGVIFENPIKINHTVPEI